MEYAIKNSLQQQNYRIQPALNLFLYTKLINNLCLHTKIHNERKNLFLVKVLKWGVHAIKGYTVVVVRGLS